jgi:predicted acyl esterase
VTASCDRPGHDVVVTLVLVTDEHGARAVSGGAMRCAGCDPAVASEHVVTLRPIAWRCPPGSRLRLDVSGARWPAFDRHPHSERSPAAAAAQDTVVATITVRRVAFDLPIEPK